MKNQRASTEAPLRKTAMQQVRDLTAKRAGSPHPHGNRRRLGPHLPGDRSPSCTGTFSRTGQNSTFVRRDADLKSTAPI